jgi:hypothetical protein
MAKRPGKARSWVQGSKPEVQRFFKRLGNRQERRILDDEARRRLDEAAGPGRDARKEPAG